MEIGSVRFSWLGHAGLLLSSEEKNLYIDPYGLKENMPPADFVFLTHSHYDHCSIVDLQKILRSGTVVFAPADVQSKLARFSLPLHLEVVEPHQEFVSSFLRVVTLPAYSLQGTSHPKEQQWVGYLLKFSDVLVYYSGDTDVIPEMHTLTGYRQEGRPIVSLLPIHGRFTLGPEEALLATQTIRSDIVVPLGHQGRKDPLLEEFLDLCSLENIRVEVLEKY